MDPENSEIRSIQWPDYSVDNASEALRELALAYWPDPNFDPIDSRLAETA